MPIRMYDALDSREDCAFDPIPRSEGEGGSEWEEGDVEERKEGTRGNALSCDVEDLEGFVAQYELMVDLTKEIESVDAEIFRKEQQAIRLQMESEADISVQEDDLTTSSEDEPEGDLRSKGGERYPPSDEKKVPDGLEGREGCLGIVKKEEVESSRIRRERLILQKRTTVLKQQLEKERVALAEKKGIVERLGSVRKRLFERIEFESVNGFDAAVPSTFHDQEIIDRSPIQPILGAIDQAKEGLSKISDTLCEIQSLMRKRSRSSEEDVLLQSSFGGLNGQIQQTLNPLMPELERSGASLQGFVQQVNASLKTASTYCTKTARCQHQIIDCFDSVLDAEETIRSIGLQLGERSAVLERISSQFQRLQASSRAMSRNNNMKLKQIQAARNRLDALKGSQKKKDLAVRTVEGGLEKIKEGVKNCKSLIRDFERKKKFASSQLAKEEESLQAAFVEQQRLEGDLMEKEQAYQQLLHSIRQYEGQLQQMVVVQQKAAEEIRPLTASLRENESKYQTCVQQCNMLYQQETLALKKLQRLKDFLHERSTLKTHHRHLMLEQIQEDTKIKLLSDELSVPMNVHHWRKLERNDPETFKLLQISIASQRQLVRKTSEVFAEERNFSELEARYVRMQDLLASQVTPDYEQEMGLLLQQQEIKMDELHKITTEVLALKAQAEAYEKKIGTYLDSMMKSLN